jgi:hypothetical protein
MTYGEEVSSHDWSEGDTSHEEAPSHAYFQQVLHTPSLSKAILVATRSKVVP